MTWSVFMIFSIKEWEESKINQIRLSEIKHFSFASVPFHQSVPRRNSHFHIVLELLGILMFLSN